MDCENENGRAASIHKMQNSEIYDVTLCMSYKAYSCLRVLSKGLECKTGERYKSFQRRSKTMAQRYQWNEPFE